MAKIRGELKAVHWRVAARGLPASETSIESIKRDVFSRPLSEGHISVVAKCGSFVYNLHIQSKKTIEIEGFFLICKKCLLTRIIKCVRPVSDFFVFKKGN